MVSVCVARPISLPKPASPAEDKKFSKSFGIGSFEIVIDEEGDGGADLVGESREGPSLFCKMQSLKACLSRLHRTNFLSGQAVKAYQVITLQFFFE